MKRIITGRAARLQLADVLQAAVVAEFINPTARLNLHAPWLGNPPLLDNRFNVFRTLLPDLGYREASLAEVIGELLARGCAIDLGVRDLDRSGALLEQVEAIVHRDRPPGQLRILRADDLPGYGVLAGLFYLAGEIEWSSDGFVVGPAGAVFHTGTADIATVRTQWETYWEGNGHAARSIR